MGFFTVRYNHMADYILLE